ncbi:hypothetical protein QM012_003380 [Aureobasidium pullulans]|uniref:Mitochondrial import inner membrane translocase subunit TIM50 n=1 Tax=Aureobasidium pullulans TaxID=5580 RepID=A0ABR0T9F5_AURPU
MTGSEERRSSERIAAQKQKEKEELEKKEKERLELEQKEKIARIAQGLPEDGSLRFKMFGYKDRPFLIERQEVWQTDGDVRVGSWATKAYWKISNFYPGQILRIIHHYPHTNLDARYSSDIGEIAMTNVEPLGVKMRWVVVLWTTSFGIFVLPMFTLKGRTSLKDLIQDRRQEYVAMVTEGTSPASEKLTPWAGHPIIMNVNPDLKAPYSSLCYADLSRPMVINAFEYLEENMGSIDGDEYLRLISLFKLKIDTWIRQSFLQFKNSPEYDELKLVIPDSMPPPSREPYDNFAPWRQDMADTEFPGQFLSRQAKNRRYQETQSKSKTTSAASNSSSGVKKPHSGGSHKGGKGGKWGRGGGSGSGSKGVSR